MKKLEDPENPDLVFDGRTKRVRLELIKGQIVIDENGIARRTSSGRLVTREIYDILSKLSKDFNIEAMEEAKAIEAKKASQRATDKYVRSNYERFAITAPKGAKEKIKTYADAHGMSINELFFKSIDEYMTNHK